MKEIKGTIRTAASRRAVVKGIGAAAGAAAFGLYAPAVHAREKTIRFLNGEPSRESVRAMQVAAAQYEKETGIKVQMDTIPAGKSYEKVQASIKSGRPYDIATLIFVGDVLILADEGKLVPINDLIKKYDWGPKILFPMNGNNYWYPYDYNLCWINYRQDLYTAQGLTRPKDWSQMLSNLDTLQGTGENQLPHGIVQPIGSNSATNYTSFGYMWANGVMLFDDDWNVVFDSPEYAGKMGEYLDFMAAMTQYMPPAPVQAGWPNLVGDFQTDKVSHTPGTGRLIDTMNVRMPERAANVGSFLFPSKDGKTFAVNHGYDGWVVLDTPMSEEAMKFLEWFSDEQLINFLHTSPVHYQPTRMDIYVDPRWLAHPDLDTFKQIIEMQHQVLTDKDVVIRSIDTEGPVPDVRAGKAFRSYALPEMLQNKIINNMSNAECIKTAADKVRAVIAS
ncbi:MAG: extracellular solute-binding protein [Kiloniellales bacterium]